MDKRKFKTPDEIMAAVRSLEGGLAVLMRSSEEVAELKRELSDTILGAPGSLAWSGAEYWLARIVALEEKAYKEAKLQHERNALLRTAAAVQLAAVSDNALKSEIAVNTAIHLYNKAEMMDWIMDDMRHEPHAEVMRRLTEEDFGDTLQDMIIEWVQVCMPVSRVIHTAALDPHDGNLVDARLLDQVTDEICNECVNYVYSDLLPDVGNAFLEMWGPRARRVSGLSDEESLRVMRTAQRAAACFYRMFVIDDTYLDDIVQLLEGGRR